MSDYYLDASALVKRYVDENGSDWVRTLLETKSLSSLVIVTADTDLNSAAAAEGLPVANPLKHE